MKPLPLALFFLASTIALLSLVPPDAHAAIPSFVRVPYATPISPVALAVPDLNGDGFPDLAVGCQSDPNPFVSVFLGNGDGTLGARSDNATGPNPVSLAVADFNRDGRLDLAATLHLTNRVSVLLGRGDGTFARAVEYPVGAFPLGIATADFNEDLIPDLVTADSEDSTLSILLGNGNGTFQTRRVVSAGGFPDGLASADMNGDGHQDVVAADPVRNSIFVFLGDGNATFTRLETPLLQGGTRAVVVADLNGDQVPDVAAVNHFSNTLSTLLGAGDGSLGTQRDFSTPANPLGIAAADLDNDGRIDLAVATRDGGTVTIFQGNGDGSFLNSLSLTNLPGPISVAAADWNRDGHMDLVAAASTASSVLVLVSLGGDVPARGFVAGNDKTIKLATNTPWCAQVEPIGGDFAVTAITPGSVELVSPGTGTVSRIPASGALVVGDRDQNSIPDATACFAKADLRALFSLVRGKQTVLRVAIEGALTDGRRFHAPFTVTVAAQGGTTAAAVVSPNPFNPSAELKFGTGRPGLVSVALLDVSGRRVRTILDGVWMPSGSHSVRIGGGALASGVYVYRIETAEGVTTGRAIVVK